MKLYTDKTKIFSIEFESEGIDQNLLFFNIRIKYNSLEIGFQGNKENSIVKFVIPPLCNFLKDIKPGEYTYIIDVTDKNKFYQVLHSDSLEILSEPKISIKLNIDDKPTACIKMVDQQKLELNQDNTEKDINIKDHKNPKIRAIFLENTVNEEV